MAPVQFWFEFASTYSYIAALRIEDLARAQKVSLEWRPFLLGPIFQRQGWNDSPFNIYQARGRYMWRDIERLCQKHRLPFRKPSQFPRNSLLAARVACLASDRSWLPEFARATFRANFADHREVSDQSVIGEILGSIGQNSAEILAAAQTLENKQRLRRQTELAWESGLFGAPSLVVEGELFWGNDRLEDALGWCAGSASRNEPLGSGTKLTQ